MKTLNHMLSAIDKCYILIIGFMALKILIGCEREPQDKSFPGTPEEIAESVTNIERILKESDAIVDAAISLALSQGGLVNTEEIAQSIDLIDGVLAATPTPSGAAIVLKLNDGTFTNVLVVKMDDEKLFKIIKTKSTDELDCETKLSETISFYPYGSGKALILAPFQESFNTDLVRISRLLISSGYMVDQFINREATLDRFRGSFLNNYDIVFIVTHGSADGVTWDGTESTLLITGEEFSAKKFNELTQEERRTINISSVRDLNGYNISVSVPWLRLTSNGRFTNTWVFILACESAKLDVGPASFSEAFLQFGAGGYNGFDEIMYVEAANPIAKTMFEKFSSGRSFKDASDAVRSDPGLLAMSWLPILVLPATGIVGERFNVATFDDNQLSTEPFYIKSQCMDIEGNVYNIVKIGNQWWMAENLKATKYNDDSPIPLVTDNDEWESRFCIEAPAYCWYDNNESNKEVYGALYNWYVVSTGKLCPAGWHVPSDSDWNILSSSLIQPNGNIGGKLKEDGLNHWLSPNTDATNESGFTALPGGLRINGFNAMGSLGNWWSSTEGNLSFSARYRFLMHDTGGIGRGINGTGAGYSVRCVKD